MRGRYAVRRRLVLAALLMPLSAPAWAHSLDDLQRQLGDKEEFFQPVDKPAPAFSLVDADGRPVSLESLREQVIVLHFIYASCPDVCPLHADKLAEVQAMVNRTEMKDLVRFVSITTDPIRDTPDVLRDYGPSHGLDQTNWTFLTVPPGQPEDTTRRLAEAFGHKFTRSPDGYQMHGVVTHLIDTAGKWRANFHGLQFESVNLVLYLNGLVNEQQRPHGHGSASFWDRVRGFLR